MKKLIILSLFFSSALFSQKEAWNDVPKQLLELYNSAHKKSKINDYLGAINDLTNAINIDSNYRAAYVFRGNMYKNQKDYGKALLDYSKSMEISDYNSFRTLAAIGYVNFELKDYSESFRIFSDIERGGVDVGMKYMKAISAYHLKEYEIAIEWFDKSILWHHNEGNWLGELGELKACYYRANSKLKLKKYLEAITDYDIVISRFGNSTTLNGNNRDFKLYDIAHYERGVAKEKLNLPYLADYYKSCELGYEKSCFLDSSRKVKIDLPSPESVLKLSFERLIKKGNYNLESQTCRYKNFAVKIDSQEYNKKFITSVEIKASVITSKYNVVKFHVKNACVPPWFILILKNGNQVERKGSNQGIITTGGSYDFSEYYSSKMTLLNFNEVESIQIYEDECGLDSIELEIECFSIDTN
jgi:tetratricopeptide (TPR) repeat protein